MGAATQQELYTYRKGADQLTDKPTETDFVFAPVCLLDHKYYLEQYPTFHFVVRKDKYFPHAEYERVCLYQEGVINLHLAPDGKPITVWISNDERRNRRIETIYRDMEEKAAQLLSSSKLSELAERRRYRS